MRLHKLSLKDKNIFTKYLNLRPYKLAVYAFENIYIWKGLFDIRWMIIKNSLCVFFKDKIGCFLYLSPLAKTLKASVIKECFRIMDSFNKNKEISRIENAEAKDLDFYQQLGYAYKKKPGDYLCQRMDLVQLKGNKFKSKRACFNYFTKHYQYEYLPFSLGYKKDCFRLYNHWMRERKTPNKDPLYQGMLQDTKKSLKLALDSYSGLNLIGRIVRINKQIKAFSFGYRLNPDTFCILYEITDLSVQGLAQFIFRRFCQELKDFHYINIMDDSGLENLKRVKLSYQPIRLIPAYIITQEDA